MKGVDGTVETYGEDIRKRYVYSNSDTDIYVSDASETTIAKAKELGYDVCVCATFKNVAWLSLYKRDGNEQLELHGVGHGCENECDDMCAEKCVACSLKDSMRYHRNVMIFKDVEEMDKFIKNSL